MDGVEAVFPQPGGPPVRALSVPSFRAEPGSVWAVVGPSGGGKSTFVGIAAALLAPSAGTVRWGGARIDALPPAARDAWRRAHVGLVFQDFHLIPELDALGNVLLPTLFAAFRPSRAERDRARALLAALGVARTGPVALLSRGERQRVAIARAVLGRPALILADEPTASLDAASGAAAVDALVAAARGSGATLIAATHDPALIARADAVLDLGARAA